MGQATIELYFSDATIKEHSILIISTDQAGWRNLLELMVNEASKLKNRLGETQHA
jgi:hypothetical protein